MKRFIKDESGAVMAEYPLLAIITILIVASLFGFLEPLIEKQCFMSCETGPTAKHITNTHYRGE